MKSGQDGSGNQSRPPSTMLPPASEMESYTFKTGGDEEVLLSFPVSASPTPVVFSAAERAVVSGVLAGKTDAEIARDRGSSSRSVAKLVRALCSKLRVSDRDELARYLERDPARLSFGGLRGSLSLGTLGRD